MAISTTGTPRASRKNATALIAFAEECEGWFSAKDISAGTEIGDATVRRLLPALVQLQYLTTNGRTTCGRRYKRTGFPAPHPGKVMRAAWGRRSKPRRKFSVEQIAQICVLRWVQEWSYGEIAKYFGVSKGAIWAIDNGRSQADLVEHLRKMHASGALTAALDAQQIRESALSVRSRTS